MRVYTVDELTNALKAAAKDSPLGNATKVCIDDFEGNLGAFGLIQTLEVFYDSNTSRVTICCDPHEAK